MADRFADDPTIHVPWIDASLTTSRVVTQEKVGGLRPDDPAALTAAGGRPDRGGPDLCGRLMRMVFEFGQFHADPHAGNVFVQPDNTVTFIDWGMVGELSDRDQERLMGVVGAFAARNDTLLLSALLNLAPAAASPGQGQAAQRCERPGRQAARQQAAGHLDSRTRRGSHDHFAGARLNFSPPTSPCCCGCSPSATG